MEPILDTIQQNQRLPPGQDFEHLRTEGLALLQRLSGQLWTDYNLHDPGVTLLEALCFVLTDLSSRASQPIPNLLATHAAGAAAAGTFVPAHEAFATHPVTCRDYERLLLDLFPQAVKNAWVSPLPDFEGQAGAPGHYQVQIELHPLYYQSASVNDELERLSVQFGEVLNTLRNLGEVFARPTILRPLAISVSVSLDLLPGYHAERVLAQVLAAIADALAPQPVSDSVDRLSAEGWATEDIFTGPVAENRLLMENTLPRRRAIVEISELLRRIRGTDGVRYVGPLRLHYQGAHGGMVEADQVEVPIDMIPQLQADDTYQRLIVSQLGVPLRTNRGLVLHEFELLQQGAMYAGGAASQLLEQRQFITRGGTYQNFGRYDSIQHLFPALYGVGLEGPPVAADAEQRASIMQLKGYLLHFEQVMADFCARLENVGQFFAIAPIKSPDYTPLYEVPFVAPLLAGTTVSPDEAWGQDPVAEARWQAYQADSFNPYVRALQPTADQRTSRLYQRYLLLTHLLARFGYTVQLQAPPEIAHEHVQEYLVGAYEQLLTYLNPATYNRTRARLPLMAVPQSTGEAESGLEFFLFLLTGLESIPRRWARLEPLERLENQVQWNGLAPVDSIPQLRVRFEQPPTQPLPEVLASLRTQLLLPGWSASANGWVRAMPLSTGPGSTDVVLPAATEVEWLGETAVPSTLQRVASPDSIGQMHRYLQTLEGKLVRMSLLDHLVLKPWPTADAVGTAQAGDFDFFHCQITVFLPAYAPAYCQPADDNDRGYDEARSYVEYLIQQYAPSHILLNTVWLSYEEMWEWEALYALLVQTSGLLNATGKSEPTLGVIQTEVLAFLELHLLPKHS